MPRSPRNSREVGEALLHHRVAQRLVPVGKDRRRRPDGFAARAGRATARRSPRRTRASARTRAGDRAAASRRRVVSSSPLSASANSVVVGHRAPQQVREPRGELVAVERMGLGRVGIGIELDAVEEVRRTRARALTTCSMEASKASPRSRALRRQRDERVDLVAVERTAKGAAAERGDDRARAGDLVGRRRLAGDDARAQRAVREHLLGERVGGVPVLLVLRLGHAQRIGDVVEAERLLVGDEAGRGAARSRRAGRGSCCRTRGC